ncbi:MAG: SusC/RagA family TonB-linked outer membrane protein [Paludibacter sp.]|nr:SusC/RagA family TonB-linked outer membrane protein [Paludibacter sp.]
MISILNLLKQDIRKLTILLLLGFSTCLPSLLMAQTNSEIELNFNQTPLEEIFKSIERQTKYTFFYKDNEVNTKQLVSVRIKSGNINEILNEIFSNAGIRYQIVKNQIVLNAAISKEAGNKHNLIKVSGIIKDELGEALIGVNIKIKGENTGTISDINGVYSLLAPADGMLDFSYIGYAIQSVSVRNQGIINVKMYQESLQINELIVTALGMKREEKALGYAVSKVSGEELSAPTTNFLNSLSGKVAGLNFNKASTGPSGSVRVTLRGESSLDLSNNGALFVVDGVPISSGMTSGGSSAHNVNAGDMPIDFGNGASDINPDDIESISVLKGASATALYGSRAANGAIIITTKSGKTTGKLGVTISSTYAYDEVSRWPDLQNEYGSGGIGKHLYYSYGSSADGASTHSSQSWGPKLEGQMYYQIYNATTGLNLDEEGNRIRTPWVAYDNWFKGFFKPGHTLTNTVTVQGGNDQGDMRLSFTDRRNDWIMENTGFSDQRIAFSGKQDITKRITLESKINYYHKSSDNLPTVGYGPTSVMYSLLTTSPNINMDWYRDYWQEENVLQDNRFNTNADNPFFSVYEQTNAQKRDRIFGNFNLNIKLLKNLSLMLRSGLDMSDEFRYYKRPLSSKKTPNGEYREQNVINLEMNHDFILRYDNRFGEEKQIGITASFGGNSMISDYKNIDIRAESLQIPGVYTLSNSKDRLLTGNFESHKVINSLYSLVQFSYLNSIYVDITGRNDWSSTLPLHNNSYFYPSISTSFIPTDFFNIKSPYLTFAKIRMSYAQVGNDTKPYRLARDYSTTSFGGSYVLPITANNPDLKPEMVTSYEFGTEMRFFRNKLGFDLTYYNSDSKNLILQVPIDPATGAQFSMQNAGLIRNWGWELSANYTPVKTKDFTWKLNGTWSKNNNLVVELAEGVDSWIITSGPRGTVEARRGGTLSAMYGSGFVRAPEGSVVVNPDNSIEDISGKIVYDAATGYPLVDVTNSKYIGETSPDWKGSFGTSVRYKNLNFSVLFDGQAGGQVYSLSYQKFNQFGRMQQTTVGRYDGLIGDGVVLNGDGTYNYNQTVTQSIGEYYTKYFQIDNVESNLVSTAYLKLREINISYSVPKKILDKVEFLESISLSLFGRDLYCWTDYPIFDPEVATLNDAEITPGFETAQLPSSRTFGATLKVSF